MLSGAMAEVIIATSFPRQLKGTPMARPRKVPPSDPLSDLSRKTEILEREMAAQRDAIDRLKQLGTQRAQPLRATAAAAPPKRRVAP
jgi:hypothetical protein